MTALRYGALATVVAIASLTQRQSAKTSAGERDSARERLIGAWHLAHIDSPGSDGNSANLPQPKGMLTYTLDGHVSVQLMYPK